MYTHVRRMRANLPFHILGLADHRDRRDAHQWQTKRLLHQELPQAKATPAKATPAKARLPRQNQTESGRVPRVARRGWAAARPPGLSRMHFFIQAHSHKWNPKEERQIQTQNSDSPTPQSHAWPRNSLRRARMCSEFIATFSYR
eukprot:COSAG02_NODE_641_length_19049_cov_119.025541_8_plen_144_part_00